MSAAIVFRGTLVALSTSEVTCSALTLEEGGKPMDDDTLRAFAAVLFLKGAVRITVEIGLGFDSTAVRRPQDRNE